MRALAPLSSTNIFRILQGPTEGADPFETSRSTSTLERIRRRSVAFLDREGETWACFLVTFVGQDGRWHGYFSFRPKDGELAEDEVRTADIFREATEGEIDRKARGLGRPMLSGMLASALHSREQNHDIQPKLRRWFRTMLAENSKGLAADWRYSEADANSEPQLGRLKSVYASYRLDQVCHLIALVRPDDFQETVARILEGRAMDFASEDVIQFAMMVVEHIEALIPLPPFEVWIEDFLTNQEAYALYSHTLHRAGRLP